MAQTRAQTAAQRALPSPASNYQGNRPQGIRPHKGSSRKRADVVKENDGDPDQQNLGDGHQQVTQNGQALVSQMCAVLAAAGQRRSGDDDTHQPSLILNVIRTELRSAEADLREFAGDKRGAAQVMRSGLAREALSSTQNTGWQHLAETHLNMYRLAVDSTPPDYGTTLAHQREHWNLHQGIGIPRMQQCYAHLRFATCYHGLGQLADAARSVIKVYRAASELTPAEVPTGNVGGVQAWVDEEITGMKRLHAFLRRRTVLLKTAEAPGLRLRDRLRIHTQSDTETPNMPATAQGVPQN